MMDMSAPIAPDSGVDLATRRALVVTTTVDGTPGSAPAVNGIDYLEVTNVLGTDPADDISELTVSFVHPLVGPGAAASTPATLTVTDVTIAGGDRVRNPSVVSVDVSGRSLVVRVGEIGDHSTYFLTIDNRAKWLDPQLSTVPFSFLVECPTRFDCAGERVPVSPLPPTPHLDLLARDYDSLRRLMLDRMSVTVPAWTERNPADLGVAVVELLAYLGDQLAYGHDVVATEAYLGRARYRTSVARHLRLVDYHLHDGHNARAWVALDVAADITVGPGARFWTAVEGHPTVTSSLDVFAEAINAGAEFFESVDTTKHIAAHNRIELHTWLDTLEVIERGATSATLRDPHGNLDLRAGSYLLLEQVAEADENGAVVAEADFRHRQVVRLIEVEALVDPLDQRVSPTGLGLLRVTWGDGDALQFDLRIGDDIAIARANLALVDHGRTLRTPVRLPTVTERFRPVLPGRDITNTSAPFHQTSSAAGAALIDGLNEGRLDPQIRSDLRGSDVVLVGEHVRPTGTDTWVASDHRWLVELELHDETLVARAGPLAAHDLFAPEPSDARPAIALYEADRDGESWPWDPAQPNAWEALTDLVRATEADQVFVAEVENDGETTLRFGDDETGKQPNLGTTFDAVYRVGNGSVGNVGADTIAHLLVQTGYSDGTTDRQTVFGSSAAIIGIRNPVGAAGGNQPESMTEARLRFPEVFTSQLRAVTPDDYVRRLEDHPLVQRALARRRWTGSWSTLFCTVDLVGGRTLDETTEQILRAWVEPWRTMGHDIEIDEPDLVPVEIELCVGVAATTLRRPVQRSLEALLGNGVLAD